jgi:CDI immunity proteins
MRDNAMGIRDHEAKRRRQTLDQLEGVRSGMPEVGDTSLVRRCLALRKVPIGEFGVEDLRLMIGQREGLLFLIPLALERLAVDPLVEGNLDPGDLLCAVLRAGAEFWNRHPALRNQLDSVIASLPEEVDSSLARAVAAYRAQ